MIRAFGRNSIQLHGNSDASLIALEKGLVRFMGIAVGFGPLPRWWTRPIFECSQNVFVSSGRSFISFITSLTSRVMRDGSQSSVCGP